MIIASSKFWLHKQKSCVLNFVLMYLENPKESFEINVSVAETMFVTHMSEKGDHGQFDPLSD